MALNNFFLKTMFALSLCLLMAMPALSAPTTDYANLPPAQKTEALGWEAQKNSLCHGYFVDEPILKNYEAKHALPAPGEKPTILSGADKSQLDINQGLQIHTGHAFVLTPTQKLTADKVVVHSTPKFKEFESVDVFGHVHLIEPERLILADHGHMNFLKNTGDLTDVLYRFQVPKSVGALVPTQSPIAAWGHADKLQQTSHGVYDLLGATYTTCPASSGAWTLKASKIHVDEHKQIATVHGATFFAKGVPIFYLPYYSFSLNGQRKTGFLSPLIGFSSTDGFNTGVPFYWNMAPNYDMTLTPMYYSYRGVSLSTLFRYLTPSSQGILQGTYFFRDAAFARFQETGPIDYVGANPSEIADLENASPHRGSVSWQDSTTLGREWTAKTNVNWVSDDYYMENFFSSLNLNPYNLPNQVLQQGQANYFGKNWNFEVLLQHYQTLHPIDLPPTANQYARLPELDVHARYPDEKGGFDYGLDGQYVDFIEQKNPWDTQLPVMGSRFDMAPVVSLPLDSAAGYLTPRVAVDVTEYILQHNPFNQTTVSRVLPIVSVDSGLTFARSIHLFGNAYTQTLEPRLFYVYIPYDNQDTIPLFDTFPQVLNYDQMFTTNRFTGIDRIGDANQATLGLKTRFIDTKTGLEKFSAAAAMIAYFQPRRVMYCTSTNCAPGDIQAEQALNQRWLSPVAGMLSYNLSPAWNVTGTGSFVPQSHSFDSGGVNFQYQPVIDHIFNVGYQFQRGADPLPPQIADTPGLSNDFNRVTFSSAWPVSDAWHVLGAWEYNISHNNGQEYMVGLSYATCCWGLQLVAARQFLQLSPDGQTQYTNSIGIQFTLKGLGTMGNNTIAQLTQIIPGYQGNL